MIKTLIVFPANGGQDRTWGIEKIEHVSLDGTHVFKTIKGDYITVPPTGWIFTEVDDASVDRS